MKKVLIVLLMVIVSVTQTAGAEEYDPQHTMLALNMAIVSVHRILSAQDRIILDQEYQNIINNLSIGNIKSDPEITELYNKLIDIIGQKRLREEEAKQVKAHYDSQMQNLFASSLSRIDSNEGMNELGLWGGAANMLYACIASYFRYQSGKNEINSELDRNIYALQAEDMRNEEDFRVYPPYWYYRARTAIEA